MKNEWLSNWIGLVKLYGDKMTVFSFFTGGKTSHLATLMQNQGTLIALDKSKGKVKHIQANATRLRLDMVKTYAYDSTKACQTGARLTQGLLANDENKLFFLDKSFYSFGWLLFPQESKYFSTNVTQHE